MLVPFLKIDTRLSLREFIKKKRELGSRFWEFVRKPKSRLDLNAI